MGSSICAGRYIFSRRVLRFVPPLFKPNICWNKRKAGVAASNSTQRSIYCVGLGHCSLPCCLLVTAIFNITASCASRLLQCVELLGCVRLTSHYWSKAAGDTELARVHELDGVHMCDVLALAATGATGVAVPRKEELRLGHLGVKLPYLGVTSGRTMNRGSWRGGGGQLHGRSFPRTQVWLSSVLVVFFFSLFLMSLPLSIPVVCALRLELGL